MKILKRSLPIVIGLFVCVEGWGAVEATKVKTARGAEVNVQIDVPTNVVGKRPAVIIASGAGYHMDAPILKELAARLAANGLIAFRFNWNYFSSTPQGQPSPELANEIQDMQAVVDFARSDARVDPEQVIVAGKSLGSVVAYEVFAKDQRANAMMLLTPLCRYLDNGKPMSAASGAELWEVDSSSTLKLLDTVEHRCMPIHEQCGRWASDISCHPQPVSIRPAGVGVWFCAS